MPLPTPPTNPIPTIATDTNYNDPGKDWDGTPTKTAPTTAIEQQGYTPEDPRPADVDNWLFATIADWLTYIVDYLTYLAESFPASSTDNAIARFDGTTGKKVQNSGVVVTDSAHVDYVTPKSETIFRAVWDPFVDTAAAQPWVQSVVGAWSTSNVASQQNTMAVPLPGLRTGMTITGAGVWVGPGAARTATNMISVELFRLDYAGTQTSLATADEDDGTTAYQFVGPTGLSVIVDTSQYDYFLLVTSGNTAAIDLCGAIEVGVDVSGLRGT